MQIEKKGIRNSTQLLPNPWFNEIKHPSNKPLGLVKMVRIFLK